MMIPAKRKMLFCFLVCFVFISAGSLSISFDCLSFYHIFVIKYTDISEQVWSVEGVGGIISESGGLKEFA